MGQEVILGLHDGSILIIQFRYLKSEVRVNEMKQKVSKYPLPISGQKHLLDHKVDTLHSCFNVDMAVQPITTFCFYVENSKCLHVIRILLPANCSNDISPVFDTMCRNNLIWYIPVILVNCKRCIIFGPRQANLVLIAYASSEGSGEPAHPRSLARTFAARSYKQ